MILGFFDKHPDLLPLEWYLRSESDNIPSLGILTRKFKLIKLSLAEYKISAQLDQYCELCYAPLNNLV